MKELYTLGRWSIHAEPETGGGINFWIKTPSTNRDFVSRGYIRTSWFRSSIRTAWNIVMKEVNKQHRLDSESLAGMEMARGIAENHLSESQIEDLLGSVLS